MSEFVRVIVDRSIRRELDYSVPEALRERVTVGSRVRVPFRDRSLLATVVATLEESSAERIKSIEALLGEKPIMSPSLLELARWMANYYCCPIETVMRSVLPQVIRKAELSWKKQLFAKAARTPTAEDLEKLRKGIGFSYPDPAIDKDKTQHIGNVRYGNEPLMLWGACPGMARAQFVAESINWMLRPNASIGEWRPAAS